MQPSFLLRFVICAAVSGPQWVSRLFPPVLYALRYQHTTVHVEALSACAARATVSANDSIYRRSIRLRDALRYKQTTVHLAAPSACAMRYGISRR